MLDQMQDNMITYALLSLCGSVSYGLGPLRDELERGVATPFHY